MASRFCYFIGASVLLIVLGNHGIVKAQLNRLNTLRRFNPIPVLTTEVPTAPSRVELPSLQRTANNGTLINDGSDFIEDPEDLDSRLSRNRNVYQHRWVLDPRGRYILEWEVDWEQSRIIFNTTVQTLGYIGFGLSKKGRMQGSDLVMGGVHPNGTTYFMDMHVVGRNTPVRDDSQDWRLHYAWQNRSHTFLQFSRLLDTCDEHDLPINDDVAKVLWSFSESNNVSQYHYQNRGVFTTYLLDPDLTPRVVHESGRFDNHQQVRLGLEQGNENVRVWTIRDTFQIPTKRTTYWCNIHKLSLPRKHHIIGIKFNINPEVRQNMHHMLLFRCNLPLDIDATLLYTPFVHPLYPGEECYSQNQPIGKIPVQACTEVKAGHAIGGVPVFYPDHVGIPVGEKNRNEYYLLQTHYDNEEGRPNLTANIQLELYYTDRVRENDGGFLSIGHHIPGSPSILLPPGEIGHRIYGHCSSQCTQRMFPPEGIQVVGALLHTHLTGRRIRMQHYRNNRELPWIFNDDNYEPLHQPVKIRRDEVTILPGDQVSMQCYHDTTFKNTTTVGGFGTDQEMCKTFLLHYTRLENYILCRSEIISDEYESRYLAGTFNYTWDQSALEFRSTIATTPQVIGMTLSEVSDSPYVDWSISRRASLRRDHIVEPHVAICPSVQEGALQQILPFLSKLLPREYVTYPIEATPYVPPERCALPQPF